MINYNHNYKIHLIGNLEVGGPNFYFLFLFHMYTVRNQNLGSCYVMGSLLLLINVLLIHERDEQMPGYFQVCVVGQCIIIWQVSCS